MVFLFTAHTENRWVLQSSELCPALHAPWAAPGDTELPHTSGRGMEEWHSAQTCPGDWCVTGHCSPGVLPARCPQHVTPLSPHIISFPRPGEQTLLHRTPLDQPSHLDALSRGWVEPVKHPEQGLNFICPHTAPSTPRVPLNTINNHHALALTTGMLLYSKAPISTKQAHMGVRPSTDVTTALTSQDAVTKPVWQHLAWFLLQQTAKIPKGSHSRQAPVGVTTLGAQI